MPPRSASARAPGPTGAPGPMQASADPFLHRRHSKTQRQVWLSLLWGPGSWYAQSFAHDLGWQTDFTGQKGSAWSSHVLSISFKYYTFLITNIVLELSSFVIELSIKSSSKRPRHFGRPCWRKAALVWRKEYLRVERTGFGFWLTIGWVDLPVSPDFTESVYKMEVIMFNYA